jgi:hypothetical protein
MTAFFLPSFPSGNYGQYQVGQALRAFSARTHQLHPGPKTMIN